ncbi:MAG: T9SS type A sorting domain-containing protein, partial [Ignavibacteriaceae bacterium]|nr:T9SS type A sorting domain-containing protein [Ignavibacteriaceae bacterium]
IDFSLAVDSKVSLKVFNVLGQEVASLLNGNLTAGSHQVNFDASLLNSGVYLYKIEATGSNGTNFIEVKKMILLK